MDDFRCRVPEIVNKPPSEGQKEKIINAVLSFLTKIASGYWHVADSQSGYAAVTLEVLKTLDLDSIYKRYGMPNDFLVRLNVYHFRVRDVPVNPIYGIGERSGIKIRKVLFTLSFLLLRLFVWRLRPYSVKRTPAYCLDLSVPTVTL
jgi:hypothetical protein